MRTLGAASMVSAGDERDGRASVGVIPTSIVADGRVGSIRRDRSIAITGSSCVKACGTRAVQGTGTVHRGGVTSFARTSSQSTWANAGRFVTRMTVIAITAMTPATMLLLSSTVQSSFMALLLTAWTSRRRRHGVGASDYRAARAGT